MFHGVPEAWSMREQLLRRGIGASAIHTEMNSIDTVTNFARSEREGHFPDDRPVVIATQAQQLERCMKIARHTLRRSYMGVVVPEDATDIDGDGLPPKLANWIISRGITPETPDMVAKVDARARRIWGGVLIAQKPLNTVKKLAGRDTSVYNTPPSA